MRPPQKPWVSRGEDAGVGHFSLEIVAQNRYGFDLALRFPTMLCVHGSATCEAAKVEASLSETVMKRGKR